MLLPRRRVGACSPSTHRMASTTLDFPQPFGPTTAVIPGAKLMLVGSRKDLKPTTSRLFRRISRSLHHYHRVHLSQIISAGSIRLLYLPYREPSSPYI